MLRLSGLCSLASRIALCLAAAAFAHADTLHFALTDSGNSNISFNIQTSPGTLTATTSSNDPTVANFYIPYNFSGGNFTDQVIFRGIGGTESLDIFLGSQPAISQFLPGIVTGTGSSPTFALGTFQLRNNPGQYPAFSALDFRLTITDLTPPVPATVTPEPSSLLLLGSGLASLAGVARRRFLSRPQQG